MPAFRRFLLVLQAHQDWDQAWVKLALQWVVSPQKTAPALALAGASCT